VPAWRLSGCSLVGAFSGLMYLAELFPDISELKKHLGRKKPKSAKNNND
jgi:hypothetical protein